MIINRYHYVINLDIASNFYIVIDPVYPGSCARRSVVMSKLRAVYNHSQNIYTNSSFHMK